MRVAMAKVKHGAVPVVQKELNTVHHSGSMTCGTGNQPGHDCHFISAVFSLVTAWGGMLSFAHGVCASCAAVYVYPWSTEDLVTHLAGPCT